MFPQRPSISIASGLPGVAFLKKDPSGALPIRSTFTSLSREFLTASIFAPPCVASIPRSATIPGKLAISTTALSGISIHNLRSASNKASSAKPGIVIGLLNILLTVSALADLITFHALGILAKAGGTPSTIRVILPISNADFAVLVIAGMAFAPVLVTPTALLKSGIPTTLEGTIRPVISCCSHGLFSLIIPAAHNFSRAVRSTFHSVSALTSPDINSDCGAYNVPPSLNGHRKGWVTHLNLSKWGMLSSAH